MHQKKTWCQHIKQMLWHDQFLDNSITHAKDECTAIAKNDSNDAKRVAIDSAYAQGDQSNIGLA
jgi:hypothetical protein